LGRGLFPRKQISNSKIEIQISSKKSICLLLGHARLNKMIGRFSSLGAYKELFSLREFYLCLGGGVLALASFLLGRTENPVAWIALALGVAAVAINGLPIIGGAARGIWERRVNVDELVSIAIIASLLQGEILTAAIVSFVMTMGSLVEGVVSDSARRSIKALVRMAPEQATLIEGGGQRVVTISEIKVGDMVLIKPGERIPVDAEIIAGVTAVDESAITGESVPRTKNKGDAVLAGTLNFNGLIEVRATRIGEDTTFGKVIRLVIKAELNKPRAARIVDRYAKWFTPVVLSCAALAWWLTGEMERAVAILIAGCPCALIMAAPTATVAAIGRLAKAGILVKGGQYLEEAARADVVLFDKTGTLTLGEPRVDEVVAGGAFTSEEVVACAAGVEQNCSHPLAKAVMKAAFYAKISVSKAEQMLIEIGQGARAMVDGSLVEVGNADLGGGEAALQPPLRECLGRIKERGATPLVVYRNQEPIGILGVSDKVKISAKNTITGLRALGIKDLGILSGDHDKSVRSLAGEIGLDKAWSELKPHDKLEIIDDYQQKGQRVIFIGDGVNDAPALARANVGIAMGAAGTDVALETADIALTHDDIAKLPFLISLSRRMLSTIKFNIGLGLFFNAAAILGSGYGLLSPISASVFHNAGSVIVVLSSASLAFAAE
jgi:Zn2+/Cd2+-exporting ATPase